MRSIQQMDHYELTIYRELTAWQKKMLRSPRKFSRWSKKIQDRLNGMIPEKIHAAITAAMREAIQLMLYSARLTTTEASKNKSLEVREAAVLEKIKFYRTTAAAEGGVTGAGGLLLGLADFPILLGLKLTLLLEIAALYGFDIDQYQERVYALYVFQLAFSSDEHRKEVYRKIENWEQEQKQLPTNSQDFDWRKLQQEYRDYIDLAKLAQLVPVIGAPVGLVANYQLLKKLGHTAMNAYRMRWLST